MIYKFDYVHRIPVIDKDFYKSSSSGKKITFRYVNAVFIKLLVFIEFQ